MTAETDYRALAITLRKQWDQLIADIRRNDPDDMEEDSAETAVAYVRWLEDRAGIEQ